MSNAEQIEYWNGEAGKRWSEYDSMLEKMLQPVTTALLEHVPTAGARRVLDVGCGCGNQTLMLSRHLGDAARVLGIDISEPMLTVAREKIASPPAIEFLQADAAEHAFESGCFDLLFSRFGVMFFADPVAAFSNLYASLADDGKLLFCCWQDRQLNDWLWLPLQAALAHLPPPPAMDPEAPGPFAFARQDRLRSILEASGFQDISIESYRTRLRCAEAPTLEESVQGLVRIGPIGNLIADQEPAVRDRVRASICEALASSYQDGALLLGGAIWFVSAR